MKKNLFSLLILGILFTTNIAEAGTRPEIDWSMAFNPGITGENIGGVAWSRVEPGVVYFAGNGSAHNSNPADPQDIVGIPRYPYTKILPEGSQVERSSRSRGVFVGKMDTATNAMEFFTFVLLGDNASSTLRITDMAVDYDGNILIVGHSSIYIEQTGDFPRVNPGPGCRNSQIDSGYSRDGFVAKISADGEQLLFACYYGASGDDWIMGVDVLPNNSFVLAMYTTSSDWGLTGDGGSQLTGTRDGFVALHLENFARVTNTYFGGSGADGFLDVKVIDENRIIAVGLTDSTDLAITANAIQPTNHGALDSMLVEFESNDVGVTYASYFGGSGNDIFRKLDFDSAANIYAVGTSSSFDYPIEGRNSTVPVATAGAVVSKFSPDLQRLLFSTFNGITGADFWSGDAIGVSDEGDIAIGGQADEPVLFPMINKMTVLDDSDYMPSVYEDGYIIKWLNVGGHYELDYQTLIGSRGIVQSIEFSERGRVLLSGDVTDNPFLDDAYHHQQISEPGVSFGPFAMVLQNDVPVTPPEPPPGPNSGGGGGGGAIGWLTMICLTLTNVSLTRRRRAQVAL